MPTVQAHAVRRILQSHRDKLQGEVVDYTADAKDLLHSLVVAALIDTLVTTAADYILDLSVAQVDELADEMGYMVMAEHGEQYVDNTVSMIMAVEDFDLDRVLGDALDDARAGFAAHQDAGETKSRPEKRRVPRDTPFYTREDLAEYWGVVLRTVDRRLTKYRSRLIHSHLAKDGEVGTTRIHEKDLDDLDTIFRGKTPRRRRAR